MELLFARLKNPQGGATLNYPDTTYIYVTESGATNKLRLVEPSVSVDEVRGKALVTVSRVGSLAGNAQVSYRTLPSSAYSAFTANQGDLTWTDGEADAKVVSITLDPSVLTAGQTGSFQVELYGPANAALESSSGSSAAALTATINVVGEGTAPTPVPPTPSPPVGGGASNNGGGGGALSLWWLAMLLALVAFATRRAMAGDRSK
jgi:hypothetical protein